MRAAWLSISFLALVFLLGPPALAQDVGADKVTLGDGGILRGTVITSEPGVSVKILVFGEVEPRVIPWDKVSDLKLGKDASTPGRPQAESTRWPPQAPEIAIVKLHIESPVPARLAEHVGSGFSAVGAYEVTVEQYRTICVAPCDKAIDVGGGNSFELLGDFPGPGSVSFAGRRGELVLTLKPGSSALRTFGIFGSVVGGGLSLGGLVLAPLSFAGNAGGSSTQRLSIGFLVAGAVFLGGGIVSFFRSRSSFTLSSGAPWPTTLTASQPWLGAL